MLTGITVEKYGEVMKKEVFKEGKLAEKREIVRAMKEDKEPIDKIIKYTGLSKEEIEKI